jgi:hypothetical protein
MNSDLFPLRGSRKDVLEQLERIFDLRQVCMRADNLADPWICSIPCTVQVVAHDVDKVGGREHAREVEVLKILRGKVSPLSRRRCQVVFTQNEDGAVHETP